MSRHRYEGTVPEALSWSSQVVQYQDAPPPEQVPAITYYPGETHLGTVDCLLYWVEIGGKPRIVGILNHYPIDMPPWERAGNVNIFVRKSHQRQGIGTALWTEASGRWPVRLENQKFTAEGAAWANHIADLPPIPSPSPSRWRSRPAPPG